MKKLNVLIMTGLVLLVTCGTALPYSYVTGNGGVTQLTTTQNLEPSTGPATHVPEPTTMLLLGSGLAALAIGARKKKK